jgi:hypothetical protein
VRKRVILIVTGALTLVGGGVASAALSGSNVSPTTTTSTPENTSTTVPSTTEPPTTTTVAPALAGTTNDPGPARSYDGCTDPTGAPFTTGNHGGYVSAYAHAGGDVATAAHSNCGMPISATHNADEDATPESEPPETDVSTGPSEPSGHGHGHGGR